jgi:hypothetical protein
LLLIALAGPAYAGAVKALGVRSGNYFFAQGATNLVPLDNTGATSLVFKGGGTYVITYTAECAVSAAAGNTVTWLNLDIIVDGTALEPTVGTSDAFCTSNGTAGADAWAMAAVSVPIKLAVGTHTLQIRANIQNGVAGNSGWLGDSSLVVIK